ncbi:hypothetical protein EPO17_00545 [Patescibacteria group bacterium]|nr:MAG: hypothetical protein EPO17_00545 [Patescibacteria group bacterium]
MVNGCIIRIRTEIVACCQNPACSLEIADQKGNTVKGTPLLETGDAKLVARAYNLGFKMVANVATTLTVEQLEYWEQNLSGIPDALRKGFGLDQSEQLEAPQAPPPPRPSFVFADTNALKALKEAEDLAEEFFGHRPDLRKQFTMPETLPWKSVIAVYDPGDLDNRATLNKALKAQKCLKDIYEESAVENYSGSEASGKPTLRFIERSEKPTENTMGLSANEMVATKRTFLDLRGYAIAFGTYHKATGRFLDSETWTRFPHNRLRSGKVADGYWDPGCSQVDFCWFVAGLRLSRAGGREAVECALATP